MDLQSMVKSIYNKDDLVRFIRELRVDLISNSITWENPTLERYLEAMQAWLNDIDGWEKNLNIDISKFTPWQLIAHILLASKMYE
ncbi:hypothetical protein Desaci_0359 [Desulfosporosinus acidiphilus SJ4]|uniref:DUF7660 domain-containing protein n=1 Tax=Desulfosporosinus acidiphilus (strain DSM 22704 / JCM 16185 / SJ4) TaxID=646529 RepID=I4D0V3_DESAJ|nr:hypothetical protein [Desulfosporosinus acidiphilus]AFM39427.1 hypothetical protein Desaci_0359 [Desulfosporosinus acidiphilus SJ4]